MQQSGAIDLAPLLLARLLNAQEFAAARFTSLWPSHWVRAKLRYTAHQRRADVILPGIIDIVGVM
ncbi:hypothetical protein PQR64_24250 [Paraburkholderia phytofirmans]|uniref:hypothetical protein n=1 Tax=Paraburkholderia phytofirmans TaxID=261302 RepID=UPI0038B95B70